jgi:AraC family transcriptional regulator, positive regulator of tynA and feaB
MHRTQKVMSAKSRNYSNGCNTLPAENDPDVLSGVAAFEAWSEELFQAYRARYNPGGEPAAFTGWVRVGSVFGFKTLNLRSNTSTQRSYRDIRLDGGDHYAAVFQVGGKTELINHNDRAVRLGAGNVILLDGARPMTAVADENSDTWNHISIRLPRKALVSHLGFAPNGGLCRPSATPAARLLLDLIRNSGGDKGSESSSVEPYMQLVIYDLVGALFASSDPEPLSRQTNKLFARISGVIRENFADPDFGPAETAARAGISLRYLHKLFTERGLTCEKFIYSCRLDHAAHLLRRRASLGTDQPLAEIGYACGFRDYAHFARKFRHRYGQPPGAHSREDGKSKAALIVGDQNAA